MCESCSATPSSNCRDLIEIDHVMMAVPDHADAIATLERIGFCVRPVRQLAAMGGREAGGNGGSAVVMLRSRTDGTANYLEIARADPETALPVMKTILLRSAGPTMLVHATSDPDRLATRWESIGLKSQQLRYMAKPLDGSKSYRVSIVLPEPVTERLHANACYYEHTNDFELDIYRNHPNGAHWWAGLTHLVADNELEHQRDRFAALYDCTPQSSHCGEWCFRPGKVTLRVATKDAIKRRFGKNPNADIVHIAVEDLKRTQDLLRQAGVPWHVFPTGIILAPEFGIGAAIAFEEV